MTHHRHRRMKPRCPICHAPQAMRHAPDCLLGRAATAVLDNCPDCDAPASGGRFDHQECCPFLRGQDATSDNDRQWFEDHPGETVRVRPPFPSEQMENSHANTTEPGSWVTHVIVTQIEPGLRHRHMHTARWIVVPT